MTKEYNGLLVFIPNREEIESVQVGSILPDCFGRMSRVAEVAYRGVDVHGKAYVGVYLEWGEDGSMMSSSYKEGRLHITLPLTWAYTSDQLRELERKLVSA